MDKIHKIGDLLFKGDQMRITIDGTQHVFDLKRVSSRLLKATDRERETFEVSPSGYGIHWPMIDEDLSVDGLLGIEHQHPGSRASASQPG